MAVRCTMLLSTLAALVIITHQEEMKEDSVEMTPKLPTQGLPEYDETPWRALDVQTEQLDLEVAWPSESSQHHSSKRRRPGRKRKRRPDNKVPAIDTGEMATPSEHEALETTRHEDLATMYENRDPPKRRRKRPEAKYYDNDQEGRRPSRRRGNRRRQKPYVPDLENTQKEHQVESDTQISELMTTTDSLNSSILNKTEDNDDVLSNKKEDDGFTTTFSTNPKYQINDRVKNDKSYRVPYSVAKSQSATSHSSSSAHIRELLKKADGLSLSELLQRHNLTLTDLITGKSQAINAIKQVATLPRTSTTSPRRGPISKNITSYVYKDLEEDASSERSKDSATKVETTTQDHNSEPGTTTVKSPEIIQQETSSEQRKLQPLHLNKLNASLEEQVLKESEHTEINRRRLPPTTPGKNYRLRMRVNRNNTNPRMFTKKRTYGRNVTASVENQTDTTSDIENVTPYVTRTTTISDQIETTDIAVLDEENQVVEDVGGSILSTKRPKQKLMPTNIDLRKRIQDKQSKNHNYGPGNDHSEPNINESDLFSEAKIATSSQFITRTKAPKQTTTEDPDDNIPDMIPAPTIRSEHYENGILVETKTYVNPFMISNDVQTSSEKTAKEEILDILRDETGLRLSKILRERNMSLIELLDQRVRGSSNIHLADIFHNASKEPNPPEPFLSKSLLEPISKKTYPLKALIEANIQEPNFRSTAKGTDALLNYGRNINENGDLFGIVSLFYGDKSKGKDVPVPLPSETPREGRAKGPTSDSNGKIGKSTSGAPIPTIFNEIVDLDGDGLIILEDLQKQKENNEMYYNNKYAKLPTSVRTVTIATTLGVGLCAIVFLMTYLACKWRISQRSAERAEQAAPPPLFDARKVPKNNCSSRSISPMLTSTTIYTVSGTDSGTGKESPDYGWNNMRAPYQ